MIRVLVFSGFGINCEAEMCLAWEHAGAAVEVYHLSSLFQDRICLGAYDLLALPGGFTFGDDLGAGRALANRFNATGLAARLHTFVKEGGAILGVCNGFQLLVKLGLLPGWSEAQVVGLARNASGRFQNQWVSHELPPSRSLFTRGLSETLHLPIRHAEGRFVASEEVLQQLEGERQVAFRYAEDLNGSVGDVGGICDATGRILGLMAHPEAAFLPEQCPFATEQAPGAILFHNTVQNLLEQKCRKNSSVYAGSSHR